MIFQDPMTSLNPVFTVGQQIAESLERHEHLNKNDAWKKAEDMLEDVLKLFVRTKNNKEFIQLMKQSLLKK